MTTSAWSTWSQFPDFAALDPVAAATAVRAALADAHAAFDRLEAAPPAGWALIEDLERLGDPLGKAWGLVHHLVAVRTGEVLRSTQESLQAEVVAYGQKVGQSRPLYAALEALGRDPGLDEGQRRIVESRLHEARLAGIGLDGTERERFNGLVRDLTATTTAFSNAVLDATKAWSHLVTDPAQVAGMPLTWRRIASDKAKATRPEAEPEGGPWLLTLDHPVFGPVMQHCRDRSVRERIYRTFVARAADAPHDNRPRLTEILRLRREQARLLGFASWAELSLSRKMAGSVDRVEELLEKLRAAARPHAERDLDDLRRLAAAAGAAEARELRPWDIAFWAERLREQRFGLKDEELRPYFALDRVLDALFDLCRRLFGIQVVPDGGALPTWHPDVRVFQLLDERGRVIAACYLDPYSRPEDKRGGAWMGDCTGRSTACAPAGTAARLPVAYLCCNQTPPSGDTPSLMSFREVETLFHEFGHGLQHMLTTVPYGPAAGIDNVEWDAVELPSQFLENWCYHLPVLRGMARHHRTSEPMPEAWIQQLLAARVFRAGSDSLRQIVFARLDLELHHRVDPEREDPLAVQQRIARAISVLPPIAEDAFLASFTHLFGNPLGYSAGYYSYKWAEVLSADAFGAFEEAGLDDERTVAALGRRFRDTVLAEGGSRHPMAVFRSFRGREPQPEALLRQLGLAGAAA